MNHKLFVARREKRLSQKKVAELLHMDRSTYNRKEMGRLFFTLPEAIKLTRILDCTLNDLFQEEETA